MTKLLRRTLRQSFNIFGPAFEQWIARMTPLTLDPGKLSRDFRGSLLSASHSQTLNRLVAAWIRMHAPQIAG